MGISKEDLFKIVEAFGGVDDPEAGANASAEAKAKAEAEARVKVEEEARRQSEALEQARSAAEEQKKAGQSNEELKALQEKLKEQELEALKAKVVSGFADKSFSREDAEKITEFFDYDKLLNQDGEVDDEKVSGMIEGISSLSLRKPPRSNTTADYSPSAGSLSKYLEKK